MAEAPFARPEIPGAMGHHANATMACSKCGIPFVEHWRDPKPCPQQERLIGRPSTKVGHREVRMIETRRRAGMNFVEIGRDMDLEPDTCRAAYKRWVLAHKGAVRSWKGEGMGMEKMSSGLGPDTDICPQKMESPCSYECRLTRDRRQTMLGW